MCAGENTQNDKNVIDTMKKKKKRIFRKFTVLKLPVPGLGRGEDGIRTRGGLGWGGGVQDIMNWVKISTLVRSLPKSIVISVTSAALKGDNMQMVSDVHAQSLGKKKMCFSKSVAG